MTEREKEVMRAKNAILVLLVTMVLGPLIGTRPPWGQDWQATIVMPLIFALIQSCVIGIQYHAKGDFVVPTWIPWTTFLTPLVMCPLLRLWPADNEVAACCFMVINMVVSAVIYWKGRIDLSVAVPHPTPAPLVSTTPQVFPQDDNVELPEAIRQVQEIIKMEGASPADKMAEIAAISARFAEQVSSLPVVS